jgi:fatty-acyl-CoA synthase
VTEHSATNPAAAGGFAIGMAELLLERAHDERTALLFGDQRWSWREFVQAAAVRASLALEQRSAGPFHIGLLMENAPEYLFWLAGAALSGATVVGINPTRRGAELAGDIAHADCQLYVTDSAGAATLSELSADLAATRIHVVGSQAYAAVLAAHASATPPPPPDPAALVMLLFTSGSTSAPKLVKCSTGRLAYLGARAAQRYEFSRDDVCYCAMPLFHGNATMGVWAPAVTVGAAMALAPRFSARAFLPDIQRYEATFFNYVGKSLSYILATPERPQERENSLRLGYGTEASWKDIETFTRRFGCPLVEGFGMSEGGGLQIRWSPDGPRDSIGKPAFPSIRIVDPATNAPCPPAIFDADGHFTNADEAIGEMVNTEGLSLFEGYYRNPEAEAERTRGGWFWSGDLAYRDSGGWYFFAGRASDRLRVDSENFAAAPVERILFRHPFVRGAAVYATPDPDGGDAVMAALELTDGSRFDPSDFEAFLAGQNDLGSKWMPRFIRIVDQIPLTGSNKVRKAPLRQERWSTTDPIWWRPDARANGWMPMTDADKSTYDARFVARGREAALR